jgi:NAD(P)-dependent dehydrogenase (short-subunit alcohol dehydrogenase family)
LAAAGQVEPLALDVADPDSVEAAHAEVERRTAGAGLDVLINSAGYALPGPLEALTDADVRAQFDTNVFGLLAVTRAFLPHMRQRGAGRIVNVGSVMGRVTMPLLGAYNASKYAVAAFTDALRMELAPFGIWVVLVEPGAVRSEFAARALARLRPYRDANSPYASPIAASDTAWERVYRFAAAPAAVSRAIERAATAPRPAARYVVPAPYRLLPAALALMPHGVADATKRRVMGW